MRTPEEHQAALARSVKEKICRAGVEVAHGSDDLIERLVDAWPHLRPLFPNTVPGQVGLSVAQKWELQGILTALAGNRGPGANSPVIRRLQRWEAVKVADRIRRLAASLPAVDVGHGATTALSTPAQASQP